MPLLLEFNVIQSLVVLAAHAQPGTVVMATKPVSEPKPWSASVGKRVKVQGAPAWLIVNGCSAMLSAPVRANGVGLASTEYCTVPSPAPPLPEKIVIQLLELSTLQAQRVLLVATLTE